MGSFTKVFSAAEFLIDERPIALPHPGADTAPDRSISSTTNAIPFESEKDVLSLLSEMMVERAGLLEEIEKLKASKPQEDEFGKFARQSVHFIDSMERILQLGKSQSPSDEFMVWLQGVESAYKRILRLFERHQLKVVSSAGQEVDLGVHEVVEYRPTKDYPHDTIIEEPLKGIMFRDRLIREGRVVVACNQ